jgi:hypothetical protein
MENLPTSVELTELSDLAERQLYYERHICEIEEKLSETKELLRLVSEVYIPETMATIGMSEFKMSNGCKITIKNDVYASIRKDFVAQAINWLDNNGLGDIVKDKVAVDFGRGESDSAKELIKFCEEHGFRASENMSVHPQTLKATVKEQMSRGIEFPEEFFSISPVTKSVIKTK